MPSPLVSLRNVTRRFGPVVANDDVSLELSAGEIHALVGENGAGKSTLMRVLYGLLSPDSGTIEIDEQEVKIGRPAIAMRHGIGMVHQHFLLVPTLTVAENVTLGHEPASPLGALNTSEARRRVAELSKRLGLPVSPEARVESLSVGEQQRVEILKALYHGARVLVLDEPTAVLTPQEVDELFGVLRALRAEGTAIVLITHKLTEVMAISDRVTVMRGGRVVGGGATATMTVDRITELMVGRALPAQAPRSTQPSVTPLLQAKLLEVTDDRGLPAVRQVSFEICAGEIVGIAGVEGNGQHELVEALAGLRPVRHGEIVIAGRTATRQNARERFAAGLAHIPSDRLHRGLVPDMTLAENLVLGRQHDPDLGQGVLLASEDLAAFARPLLSEYDIRPPDPEAPARRLSGGNQQKLIAARELSRGALVVLAAHPTRGVDLGAIAFIHRRLLDQRAAGRGLLLVSSELSEILALSDRVFVMYGGRFVHETRASDTDERTLGLFMTGRREAARSGPPD